MEIQNKCKVSTDDFWGDLFEGGYLQPEKMLKNDEDVKRVAAAIETLKDFQRSCEEQIEDFYR